MATGGAHASFVFMTDKSTEWAEDRTDWAEDRTILANERTFAGWMRTGMAALAVALGLKAVFRDFEPTWIARAVAEVFVIAAILIFWAAQQNASRTQKRMNSHETDPQSRFRMTVISVILTFGALATGIVLWFL